VSILAAQNPWSGWMCVILAYCRDINKQATIRIHPTRINDVQLIALIPNLVEWINLEHIIAALGYPRCSIMEDGHVVVAREEVHRFFSHLHVDVGVPRQDLSSSVSVEK